MGVSMKNYLAGAVLLVGVQVAVANAGVNVDINIGNPRPMVVVPEVAGVSETA